MHFILDTPRESDSSGIAGKCLQVFQSLCLLVCPCYKEFLKCMMNKALSELKYGSHRAWWYDSIVSDKSLFQDHCSAVYTWTTGVTTKQFLLIHQSHPPKTHVIIWGRHKETRPALWSQNGSYRSHLTCLQILAVGGAATRGKEKRKLGATCWEGRTESLGCMMGRGQLVVLFLCMSETTDAIWFCHQSCGSKREKG